MLKRRDKLSQRARRAQQFIAGILTKDVAEGTLVGRAYQWRKWRNFAKKESFNRLPASPYHVSLYLAYICERSIRKDFGHRPVVEAQQAIRYVHETCELPNPTTSALAKAVVKFARRHLTKKTKKSRKLTAEILKQMATRFSTEKDVGWFMVFVILTVGFIGFLRWNDITNIYWEQVLFFETHVALFVVKSKTDQMAKGHWIFLARNGGAMCPHDLLVRLVERTKVTEGVIPREVQRTKNGCTLTNRPLRYKRFLELLREALVMSGYSKKEAKEFGTRCMRVGGASAAAEFGVPDRLFRKHGRWLTESIKDNYVQEDLEARLTVSRMLGAELQ